MATESSIHVVLPKKRTNSAEFAFSSYVSPRDVSVYSQAQLHHSNSSLQYVSIQFQWLSNRPSKHNYQTCERHQMHCMEAVTAAVVIQLTVHFFGGVLLRLGYKHGYKANHYEKHEWVHLSIICQHFFHTKHNLFNCAPQQIIMKNMNESI